MFDFAFNFQSIKFEKTYLIKINIIFKLRLLWLMLCCLNFFLQISKKIIAKMKKTYLVKNNYFNCAVFDPMRSWCNIYGFYSLNILMIIICTYCLQLYGIISEYVTDVVRLICQLRNKSIGYSESNNDKNHSTSTSSVH